MTRTAPSSPRAGVRPAHLAGAALALLLLAAAPGQAVRAAPPGDAPITLDDALALAARGSHELAIARADVTLAGADTTGTLQGLLPRLDLTSSAGRQFFGPGSLSQVDPTTGQVVQAGASDYAAYALDLRLSQPLFDLGAWRRRGQAKASERAATLGHEETRLTVAFDVTRRFYRWSGPSGRWRCSARRPSGARSCWIAPRRSSRPAGPRRPTP
jgi:outer membrane protein TolC